MTVVDQTGSHVYQPGFMYIAMGGERAANLQRPERSLLDRRVQLVVGEIAAVDPTSRIVTLTDGLRAALRPARPRDRLADRARGDRALRRPRPTTSTPPRPPPGCATALDAFTGGTDRHRHRRDAVQVPAGAARGRLPHRGRAPRARPAREERAPLLLADRAGVHDRDRSARWPPRSSSRRGSSSTRSSTSRRSTRSGRSS